MQDDGKNGVLWWDSKSFKSPRCGRVLPQPPVAHSAHSSPWWPRAHLENKYNVLKISVQVLQMIIYGYIWHDYIVQEAAEKGSSFEGPWRHGDMLTTQPVTDITQALCLHSDHFALEHAKCYRTGSAGGWDGWDAQVISTNSLETDQFRFMQIAATSSVKCCDWPPYFPLGSSCIGIGGTGWLCGYPGATGTLPLCCFGTAPWLWIGRSNHHELPYSTCADYNSMAPTFWYQKTPRDLLFTLIFSSLAGLNRWSQWGIEGLCLGAGGSWGVSHYYCSCFV